MIYDSDEKDGLPGGAAGTLPGRQAGPNQPAYPGYGYQYGYNRTASEKSLFDYLRLLFRFRWLIAVCTVAGLVLGVLFRHTALPKFESAAVVNIGTYALPLDSPAADAMRSETSSPEYVNNLIALLDSYAIARQVLFEHPEVVRELFGKDLPKGTMLAASKGEEREIFSVSMLDHYLSHIWSQQLEDTSLVIIKGTASSPRLAALLANAHAEAFTEMVRKQRFVAARTNVEFLQQRFDEAKIEAEKTEREMISFAQKHSLPVGVDVFQDVNSQKYRALIDHLGSAVESRTQAAGELRQLVRATRSTSSAAAVSDKTLPIASRIAELNSLKNQMKQEAQGDIFSKDIDRQIVGLRRLLKVTAQHEVEQSKIRKRAAEEKERLLRREIDRLQGEERDRYEIKVKYALLMREAERAKEVYSELKDRLDDAVISAESDRKTVTIVDPALAPASALPMQRASSVLSGAFIGLLFGVALALLIDLQDSSIRSVDDLNDILQAPLLGAIPQIQQQSQSNRKSKRNPVLLSSHNRDSNASRFSSALDTLIVEGETIEFGSPVNDLGDKVPIVIRSPLSRESESFRNIRTTMQFSAQDLDPRVILITSGQKGDGKTTVATNLAACLAQTKCRTVLIDADMRMPTVHTYFGIKRNATGLSDYLASSRTGGGSPIKVGIENLWVLPAGSLVASPGELLCTPRLSKLIDQLKEEFDYVVVDAPPVGDMSDALLLSRVVDGVIMVFRSGHTTKAVARSACSRLAQVRAPIIGVALNGTEGGVSDKQSFASMMQSS